MLQPMNGVTRSWTRLSDWTTAVYWYSYGGLVTKNPPVNAGDGGSIPGLGRSLKEGNGNSFQYSGQENAMDGGPWQATVHRVTEELEKTSQQNNNNSSYEKAYCTHHVTLFTESQRKRVWTRSHVPSLRGFDKWQCSRSRDSIIKYYWGWNDGSKLRATSVSIQLDNKFQQHVLLYQFMCH